MRLWVEPLPAHQRIAACFILGSTRRTMVWVSWVRTCSGARQILLLARRLAIGLGVVCWGERLAVCAVHGRRLTDAAPDGVCGHKGLRLGGNGGEDAVLVEAHAV